MIALAPFAFPSTVDVTVKTRNGVSAVSLADKFRFL